MSITPLDLRSVQVRLSSDVDVVIPDKLVRYTIDTQAWDIWDGSAYVPFVWPTATDGWRLATKTVTFVAGTTGAVGAHDLFTLTGLVKFHVYFEVMTDLTSGGAAVLKHGTASDDDKFDASGTGFDSYDAGQIGIHYLGNGPIGIDAASTLTTHLANEDIIYTVDTAAITGGVIRYFIEWVPLSSDGNLVAA